MVPYSPCRPRGYQGSSEHEQRLLYWGVRCFGRSSICFTASPTYCWVPWGVSQECLQCDSGHTLWLQGVSELAASFGLYWRGHNGEAAEDSLVEMLCSCSLGFSGNVFVYVCVCGMYVCLLIWSQVCGHMCAKASMLAYLTWYLS